MAGAITNATTMPRQKSASYIGIILAHEHERDAGSDERQKVGACDEDMSKHVQPSQGVTK